VIKLFRAYRGHCITLAAQISNALATLLDHHSLASIFTATGITT
jgi:hypothetical protein